MRHVSRYTAVMTPAIVGCLLVVLSGCGALVTSSPSIQATGSTAVVKSYPTPQGTPTIYSNALTTPAPGWAHSPECTVTSTGLMVKPNGGQAYICLAPTSPLTDASITVTMQETSGSMSHAYGIAFHHASPQNYYFFGIDGHGRFTFTVVVNDVSHIIIPFTAAPTIHTGINATNQLQVITKGKLVTCLVNSKAVAQATVSTFPSGSVGLRGINDGTVVFQQLSVAQV
ncbi:MAG: hypothetical protein ACR2H5_17660 [Ktedonobacteraceae bacterium]